MYAAVVNLGMPLPSCANSNLLHECYVSYIYSYYQTDYLYLVHSEKGGGERVAQTKPWRIQRVEHHGDLDVAGHPPAPTSALITSAAAPSARKCRAPLVAYRGVRHLGECLNGRRVPLRAPVPFPDHASHKYSQQRLLHVFVVAIITAEDGSCCCSGVHPQAPRCFAPPPLHGGGDQLYLFLFLGTRQGVSSLQVALGLQGQMTLFSSWVAVFFRWQFCSFAGLFPLLPPQLSRGGALLAARRSACCCSCAAPLPVVAGGDSPFPTSYSFRHRRRGRHVEFPLHRSRMRAIAEHSPGC